MRCKNANGFVHDPARLLSSTVAVGPDDRCHTNGGRLHHDMWDWEQAENRIRANMPHSPRKHTQTHTHICMLNPTTAAAKAFLNTFMINCTRYVGVS